MPRPIKWIALPCVAIAIMCAAVSLASKDVRWLGMAAVAMLQLPNALLAWGLTLMYQEADNKLLALVRCVILMLVALPLFWFEYTMIAPFL